MRGYYSIHTPYSVEHPDEPGRLEIGPHSNSRKHAVYFATGKAEKELPIKTIWHWGTCLIIFILALGWAFTDSFFLHDWMTNETDLSETIIAIIETGAALALSTFSMFVLSPALNDAFNGEPEDAD